MLLGYNTNGFAHHELGDVVDILSEIGYRSVALTLEQKHLNPPDRSGARVCVQRLEPLIAGSGLALTIETGARFVLDAHRKHQPTLLSRSARDRGRRIEFLKAAIDVAAALSADCVSLWSGTADHDADEVELLERLTSGLTDVLDHAENQGVRLAFEPEPGMFIDTMQRFGQLIAALDHPLLGLTLDVGHLHCLEDGQLRDHLRRWRDRLWNIHIEDMRRGLHQHLMFGDGDMDFADIFAALGEIDYRGPLHVELSRHSHDAVNVAGRSYTFLRAFM